MSLTSFAIKVAVKVPNPLSFENYLFVGPHPDDIEIGCGATIAKLKKLNKKVTFVIATDGRYGKDNCKGVSDEELIKIRKEESKASAKYLNVDEIIFLDLCDGYGYDYNDLTSKLAKVINDVKPDIVFATDPDIKSECHMDHLNIGRACKEVAYFANYPEIFKKYLPSDEDVNDINVKAIAFYMTNKPNKYVKITKEFKTQLSALFDYHLSQYPKNSSDSNALALYLKIRSTDFGLRSFHLKADGFRVLGRTHMHCLPEMGK